MGYEPFVRGAHPVGVQTREVVDGSRDERSVTVELWYPAAEAHRGQDLDPELRDRFDVMPGFPVAHQAAVRDAAPGEGRYPLVGFSHGFGTERRQSSFLCTHLASHGYVVVSPNHPGNTMLDIMGAYLAATSGGALPDIMGSIGDVAKARPLDMLLALGALDAFGPAGELADDTRIGLMGHSFGGWTALTTAARDPRVCSVLGLAPAGGRSVRISKKLSETIDVDYDHDVDAVLIVADRDSLLPIASMHDLFGRMTCQKRMFVLHDTDHMHFCDRPRAAHDMFRVVPGLANAFNVTDMPAFSELCPAELALSAQRGIGLAHFDATLKASEPAADFLRDDAVSTLARRGIAVERA